MREARGPIGVALKTTNRTALRLGGNIFGVTSGDTYGIQPNIMEQKDSNLRCYIGVS